MKFQEAFDKVAEKYDKIKEINPDFSGGMSLDALKGAVFAWNMIALAIAEKGLDDFVFIVNNDIKSVPLLEKENKENPKNAPKDKNPKNKKGKGKSPQPETALKETVDGKEATTEESSEQSDS